MYVFAHCFDCFDNTSDRKFGNFEFLAWRFIFKNVLGEAGAATFLPIALFQLKNRLHDQKFNHYFIQLQNNKLFHGNV